MNLREKLLAKKCPERLVTIDGDEYLVVGLSRLARAELMDSAPRDKDGKLVDVNDIERAFLSACVCDPASRTPLIQSHESALWDQVPTTITSVLIKLIREFNGLDAEDVATAEKK